MKSINKLCSVERDRVTAAEICIDECLTIMDRHGERGPLYAIMRNISQTLNEALREADGMNARYERLIRIRAALTTAFPMKDDDLERIPEGFSDAPGNGGATNG